jgi:hypothetical protein
MPSMIKKSFNAPEEIRHFDKGKVEVVHLGDLEVIRVTNQPGWRWSECVKPTMGTESCPVTHLINVISGRTMVRLPGLGLAAGGLQGHLEKLIGRKPKTAGEYFRESYPPAAPAAQAQEPARKPA